MKKVLSFLLPAVYCLLAVFCCLLSIVSSSQTWNKVGNSAYTEVLKTINNELYATAACYSISNPPYSSCPIVKWNGNVWDTIASTYSLGAGYARCFLWYNNELYVGGDGTAGIGKWDGSKWTVLGSIQGTPVNALEVFNGEIYATGNFTAIGGVPTRSIGKWNGTNWSAVGGGLTGGTIQPLGETLLFYKNDLYVGGDFNLAGNINCIAKWNGTQWDSVGTGGPSQVVYSLIADTTNDFLYAGGNFAGENYATGRVGRWDGFTWSFFDTTGIYYGIVQSICIYHNQLYAAGQINTTDGTFGIARWNGSYWESVGGGTDGYVFAAQVYKDELYVAGSFTRAGGDTTIKWMARWYSPPDTTCKFLLQPVIESMSSLTTPNGVADTFYFTDSVAVQFYNNIASASSWQWNYGDGNTGSGKTPVHYYKAAGTYTISVIVNYPYGPKGPCIDTTYKTITVIYGTAAVNELQQNLKFKIYPNPAKKEINIEVTPPPNPSPKGEGSYIARVKNSLGQNIFEQKFEKELKINTSDFKTGNYFVEVCTSEGKVCHTEKVVIE